MYDDALHFVGLRLEGLPLPVLGVVLAQVDGDLGELGLVDAVRRRRRASRRRSRPADFPYKTSSSDILDPTVRPCGGSRSRRPR